MKKELAKGVMLNCIHTDKFKDIAIYINFLDNADQRSATKRSLLALMMSDRCEKYNTKQKMSNICDHLYGATLACRTYGCGAGHVFELRSKIVNPVYINESANLLNDQLELISEIIFKPLFIDGVFSADLFNEAKRILTSKIWRRIDDAQTYSIHKAFKLAGGNQPLATSSIGSLEDLENITVEEVSVEYHKMLKENAIEIVVCGQFDENQMVKLVSEKLAFNDRVSNAATYYALQGEKDETIVREEREIPQSNIAMVWRHDVLVTDELYSALKVANGIFGQYPSSFLFQEVREKNSLCYSIFSNLISFDGAMLMSTGVEHENVERTIKLVKEQLKRCQNGEFSDELMEMTKKMMINGLKTSLDDMNSIAAYAYNNSLLNRNLSIEENIERIHSVKREDVLKVFNQLQLVTTFVLSGKESVNE